MFRSSVLDRGLPGLKVFWEDRDRTKTDPQRPKDRRSFSVLKLANFLADFRPICSQIWINFWISLFPKCQWWVGPQKWTDCKPIYSQMWVKFLELPLNKLLVICWASFCIDLWSLKRPKKARRPMQKRPDRLRTERERTETAQRPEIAGPEHHYW